MLSRTRVMSIHIHTPSIPESVSLHMPDVFYSRKIGVVFGLVDRVSLGTTTSRIWLPEFKSQFHFWFYLSAGRQKRCLSPRGGRWGSGDWSLHPSRRKQPEIQIAPLWAIMEIQNILPSLYSFFPSLSPSLSSLKKKKCMENTMNS